MFWTYMSLLVFSSFIIHASDQKDCVFLGDFVWGVQLEDTYLQFFPRSLLECARDCLKRKRCRSINYSRALSMCELNYNAIDDANNKKQNNVFVCSDITTWPKKLAGRCEVNTCKEREVCNNGSCSVSDCGQIDFPIPENSVLLMSGHHEIGNGVAFKCKEGYVMNNHLDNTDEISTVLCQQSGQWQPVNFTCYEGCKFDDLEKHVHNNAEVVDGLQGTQNYKIRCKNGYTGFGTGGESLTNVDAICNSDIRWVVDTIHCCKLDELEIDKNAEIVENIPGNQSYTIRCKTGYSGFGAGGETLEIVRASCNSAGKWVLDSMHCINPKSILQDFCPSEYSYESQHNLCFKYHNEDKSYERAKQICQNEHAHLISLINNDVRNYILKKFEDKKSVFIDGTYVKEDTKWRGWDGQQVSIVDGPVDAGHNCLMVENKTIHYSQCDEKRNFICQFEICPESAGYTLDTQDGLCYKFHAASEFNYTNEMCELTNDDSFKVDFVKKDTDVEIKLYKNMMETKDNSLQKRAYVLFDKDSISAYTFYSFCKQRNLHAARVDTADEREYVTSVIGNRASSVVVGLYLNWRATYLYVFKDGKRCTVYVGWQLYTDSRKCYKARRHTNNQVYFSTIDCNMERRSLCAELKSDGTFESFVISNSTTNYEEAGKWCEENGMSLVKISSDRIKNDVKEFLKNQTLIIDVYIDVKLHSKSYTYYWAYGGRSSWIDWAEDYSNDTRDDYRRVAFNVTSQKFHLIPNAATNLIGLCSTQSNTVWSGESDGTDNAFVFDKYLRRFSVSVKNRLPYICEVDMKSMIEKLHLYKKKKPLK